MRGNALNVVLATDCLHKDKEVERNRRVLDQFAA